MDSRVTFSVSCNGNVQALNLCVASVLNGTSVPHVIRIRMEGAFPAFANFYLEQLAELARVFNVEFSVSVAASQGVRVARDWHVAQCKTPWLWMGDDDVVYSCRCLEYFGAAVAQFRDCDLPMYAFFQGIKFDVNNRRGYEDYHRRRLTELPEAESANHLYDHNVYQNAMVPFSARLDCGNLLLNVPVVRKAGLKFDVFSDASKAGGEDVLFGYMARRSGLLGALVPTAESYHLEKEKVAFNEPLARAEAVRKSQEILQHDNTNTAKPHTA